MIDAATVMLTISALGPLVVGLAAWRGVVWWEARAQALDPEAPHLDPEVTVPAPRSPDWPPATAATARATSPTGARAAG